MIGFIFSLMAADDGVSGVRVFIIAAMTVALAAYGIVICSHNSRGWAANCEPGIYKLSNIEYSMSSNKSYMSLRAVYGDAEGQLRLCQMPLSNVHFTNRPETIRLTKGDTGLHAYEE